MADKDTLMEEFVATEAAKNEDAAKDLERVEQEIVAEATMSTEYDDALGNEQAAAELMSLLHDGLEVVIAMHVSENNNDYELPAAALREALAREGHEAAVHVAYQRKLVSI